MSSAYDLRANQHRPADVGQLDAEIRRLNRNGLTPRDVAVALRLSLDAVVAIIYGETDHGDIEPGSMERDAGRESL